MKSATGAACKQGAGQAGCGNQQSSPDPEGSGGPLALLLEGSKTVCEEDGSDDGEGRVCGGDVVRKARLNNCEESDDNQGEDRPCAELFASEGIDDCEGVEQNEGGGRDEEDPQVVPPVSDVILNLMGCAGYDVEAEVFGEKAVTETMSHIEVPGQNGEQEEQEAEPEGFAKMLCFPAFDSGEDKGSEDENDAGCALGHEGDGEPDPKKIPTVEFVVLNCGKAAERDTTAKGEQHVHLAHPADMQKAEGAEED